MTAACAAYKSYFIRKLVIEQEGVPVASVFPRTSIVSHALNVRASDEFVTPGPPQDPFATAWVQNATQFLYILQYALLHVPGELVTVNVTLYVHDTHIVP